MAKPYCVALMLATHVTHDSTEKWHIIGTMNTVTCATYPIELTMGFYAALTDGTDRCRVKLRIVRAEDDSSDVSDHTKEICSITATCEFPSPFVVVEWGGDLKWLVPAPGEYLLEICADDEVLMARRLRAFREGQQ